jgi:hypothetical protein
MARLWWRQLALVAVAGLAMASPARAQEAPGTQAASGNWRQTVHFYGMGAMIEGDAQVGPVQVPVDVSMSDFFDNLEFGAMAAYGIENGTWSFAGDVTYMSLGGGKEGPRGLTSARLDTDQTTVMLTVGRRVTPHLEALVSLAYFDVNADLRARVLQQVATASRDVDWFDPLIGFRYVVPMGGKWSYTLRGDIGGGGSDLTWHALTRVTRQNSDRFGWYLGYRALSYDYEDGSGLNSVRFDLTQHGPGAGISISF